MARMHKKRDRGALKSAPRCSASQGPTGGGGGEGGIMQMDAQLLLDHNSLLAPPAGLEPAIFGLEVRRLVH